MVLLQGRPYVFGGMGSGTRSKKVYMMDLRNDGQWVTCTDLPVPLGMDGTGLDGHAVVALPADAALLCGGGDAKGNVAAQCSIYDAVADVWAWHSNMITPRRDHALDVYMGG